MRVQVEKVLAMADPNKTLFCNDTPQTCRGAFRPKI